RDVDDLHTRGTAFGAALVHRVVEHDQAVRARRRDQLGSRTKRFIGAVDVDAGADAFFHPHPRTARAATETAATVPLHLDPLYARDRVENRTRLGHDLVVPT